VKRQNRFAEFAQRFARHVVTNVESIKQNIARNARRLVSNVQRNAEEWRPDRPLAYGFIKFSARRSTKKDCEAREIDL
jgi:hypothetical protein